MSFKEKTAKGFVWNLVDTLFNYAGMFIINIILARLLSPAEFGIIGMLTIFISIFESLIDGGFTNALIRSEKVDNHDYNTVFVFNLAISVVLYVLFFFGAPAICDFFNEESLAKYAYVLGLIIIIHALCSVQRTILTKAIDFKYQAMISITSTIISGTIGIYMAFKGYGVWSLIAQQLSRALTTTLMFWIKSTWYPHVEFSVSSFKRLFSFGWKVMISSIIGTIGSELTSTVIGKVYSKETLGLYSRARQFTDVISIKLTSIIRRVTFPAFSSIQQEEDYLLTSYRKMQRIVALISCTALMVLGAIAEPMIELLLGDKWLPCAPFLALLCFMWFFYAPNVLNLNMLQVKGRSDLFLYDQIMAVVIGFIPLVFAIKYSVMIMIAVSIGTQFVMYIIGIIYCSKVIDYSLKMQIKDLLPVYAVAIGTFILVRLIGFIHLGAWPLLILQLLASALISISLCFLLCRHEYMFIHQSILGTYKRFILSKTSN